MRQLELILLEWLILLDFLDDGLEEPNTIYAKIDQIHHRESKTPATVSTIHQEAGGDQEENVGRKHGWIRRIPHQYQRRK
jgi:hypothetical protein